MRKALIIDRNGSCYALFLPTNPRETTSLDYKRKTNLLRTTLLEKGYQNLSDNITDSKSRFFFFAIYYV